MRFYNHLTLEERGSLYLLRKAGYSLREIGEELGRSASSISRELKRNLDLRERYNPWNAHHAYLRRRRACVRKGRLAEDPALYAWTIGKLSLYWPPETIVALWKKRNPEARLSHGTIYRAIRKGLLPDIREATHLRRRGKQKFKSNTSGVIKADRRIRDWPSAVTERLRPGDWEGDTVCGSPGKGVLLTLVDRQSRFLIAKRCTDRKAQSLRKAVVSSLKGKPVHTLSFDNGVEFAQHRLMASHLHADVFFADPHSPWQRGSNENINGLLRFFFPKGTNFLTLSQRNLSRVVDLINDRPRKCLGWLSPRQVFFPACCT